MAAHLEVIGTLRQCHHSLFPLVALVTSTRPLQEIFGVSAVEHVQGTDTGAPHVVPELKCTLRAGLAVQWTYEMCIRSDAGKG